MTGGVTLARLDSIRECPVALPQTQLMRANSLVISSTKLELGQRLRVAWLSLRLISVTSGTPTKLNSSLGMVYAGIYAGGISTVNKPSGVPIHTISMDFPATRVLNPYIPRDFYGPDVIEVVVVNNMTNVDVELTLSGNMKVFIKG